MVDDPPIILSTGVTRPVQLSDRPCIAELASHTYGGNDWIMNAFEGWIASPLDLTLGIVFNGSLRALENLRLVDDGRTGWIEALRVHPTVRRRGLAMRLQSELIKAAKDRWPTIERFRYTTASFIPASLKIANACGMKAVHRWGFSLASSAKTGSDEIAAHASPTELCARLRKEYEKVNIQVAEETAVMSSCSAADVTKIATRKGSSMATVGMLCDWKVECACDRAVAKLFEAGTTAAVLRNDNGRESLSLGRTRPDFTGTVRVWTIEVDDIGHLNERYRDFLVLAIHECEIAEKHETSSCMFFFPLEFNPALLAAKITSPEKECILLEGGRCVV